MFIFNPINNVMKKTRKPQQKRSKQKVDRIIKSARKLFSKNGYAKTTMSLIAREAGVSIGTAYAYFADKDELLQEVLRQHIEEILCPAEKIMDELSANANIEKTLKKLISCFIKVHKIEPGLQNIFFEKRITDNEFKTFVVEYRERGRQIGRRLIERFANRKVKRSKEAAAQVIVGLLDFCTHIGTAFPSEITIEQACKIGVEMIVSYFKDE